MNTMINALGAARGYMDNTACRALQFVGQATLETGKSWSDMLPGASSFGRTCRLNGAAASVFGAFDRMTTLFSGHVASSRFIPYAVKPLLCRSIAKLPITLPLVGLAAVTVRPLAELYKTRLFTKELPQLPADTSHQTLYKRLAKQALGVVDSVLFYGNIVVASTTLVPALGASMAVLAGTLACAVNVCRGVAFKCAQNHRMEVRAKELAGVPERARKDFARSEASAAVINKRYHGVLSHQEAEIRLRSVSQGARSEQTYILYTPEDKPVSYINDKAENNYCLMVTVDHDKNNEGKKLSGEQKREYHISPIIRTADSRFRVQVDEKGTRSQAFPTIGGLLSKHSGINHNNLYLLPTGSCGGCRSGLRDYAVL